MQNQDINLTNFDPDAIKFQRQQQLADLLRQQSMQDIPINSYNGIQAPISPFSVLAKAIQGYSARKNQELADSELSQYHDKDTAAARALAAALTKQSPAVAPVQTQIDSTLPQLPGQAPQPKTSVPVSVGGIQAAGPSQSEQMAMLLGADGGPQTQMIQNAMLPQVLNRQNKEWENTQPMSAAMQQQIAAQGQQQQDNARFTNALPMTAAQRASNAIEQGKLAEDRSYHQSLTGAGIGGDDPQVGYWTDAVAKGNVPGLQAVPKRYQPGVAKALATAPQAIFAPIAGRRFGQESNSIVGPLMKLPQYELTAQGLPYIQRIQAALAKPGSVSDQELLDSFTKLSTSGNAITDAQVRIITDGKSLSDWASTLAQRLGTGGVLSSDQRKQIRDIATKTYAAYKAGYEPLYKEATEKLTAAGIPKAFWTIPDLNKLNAAQTGGGGGANIAPAGTKATGPGGKVLTSDGKGGWN